MLTPEEEAWSLAKSRSDLGNQLLKGAQLESNSLSTRYDCAFDALYLYALAAIHAPDGLQSHPQRDFLLEGARRLNLNMHNLAPIGERMDNPFTPLIASYDQVRAITALAIEAQQALQVQRILSGGPK